MFSNELALIAQIDTYVMSSKQFTGSVARPVGTSRGAGWALAVHATGPDCKAARFPVPGPVTSSTNISRRVCDRSVSSPGNFGAIFLRKLLDNQTTFI